MNVAFLLHPKVSVSFLYDDWTLRQALEKMRHSGYRAIPVLTREGKYLCTATEGDFLWYLVDTPEGDHAKMDIRNAEHIRLREVIRTDYNPPVRIDAEIEELISRAMEQNFIPVVDDRDIFIGIVTRRDIIAHLIHREKKR